MKQDNDKKVAVPRGKPRCVAVFDRSSKGEMTSIDFAQGFVVMMSDLASGRLNPNVGNAICNAGGKVLKVKEMEIKFGVPLKGGRKLLALAQGM